MESIFDWGKEDVLSYEIHITFGFLKNVPFDEAQKHFKLTCKNANVKPTIINKVITSGCNGCEFVTSSLFKSTEDLTEVYRESDRIIDVFNKDKNLYRTDRVKIETTPLHPGILKEYPDDSFQYLEVHFPFLLKDYYDQEQLSKICRTFGLLKSRNILKDRIGEYQIQMITLRSENHDIDLDSFTKKIKMIESDVKSLGLSFSEKPKIEFIISDNNYGMDLEWLKSNKK
jgi:hypothetical protein